MKKQIITFITLILLGNISANASELAGAKDVQAPSAQQINAVKNENKESTKDLQSVKQVQESIKPENVPVFDQSPADTLVMQGSVVTHKIITVDDCIRLAMENNPAIKAAMYNAEATKSKIAQAWSNYFPKLGAGIGYTRNNMMIANFNVPQQTYNMFHMPTLSADMLLFDFGKTSTDAKIKKLNYKASEDNVNLNINDVIFKVKQGYYNLLYAYQQEQVYADTVANYEMHLQQAEAYYQIGTKAKIDVVTAQYNLGNSKLSLIKAKNNINLAYANLNNALGLPEYANYSIDEKNTSKLYDIKFEDALKTAFEVQPELLAAKKKAEASRLLVKATKVAFLPDVKLSGNFISGGTSPGKDYSYQFGGVVEYKQVNLLLLKKQMDEAKATMMKDEADYKKIEQKVYLNVQSAYIQLKNAQESVPVAKLAMLNAREQYDLASGRYKVGLGDAVELKDAENTYRNAQLEYYNTILNYNISAANLERVIGSPLTPTNVPLI